MKQILAILLALILLSGCGSTVPETTEVTEAMTEAPETTVAAEPTETEPPKPKTEPVKALADNTAVVLTTANRDDILNVVDEYDEKYYVVKLETGYGLVEKRLTRLDSEAAYEQWTGYATYGAKLYSDYLLRGEVLAELWMNQQVTVLDSLGDILVVQFEETIGYLTAGQISSYFIQPAPGGSGGSGGADGGDISLGCHGGISLLGTFVPQEGEVSGTARVLADAVPILLGWFDREETVELVTEAGFAQEKEGFCTVYLDGIYGYIRHDLLARKGEAPYEEWDGYAFHGAQLYDNYDLNGKPDRTLDPNEAVHVLLELDNCYLVAVGEGGGYLAKDQVSEYYIVYGGGNSGSESSGDDEWSPPML